MKLQGDELRIFIEQYADEIAPDGVWKQKYFYIGKYIPEKKLKDAVSFYANLSDGEIPLFLYDGTVLGSAKVGMLLTASRLYCNVSRNANRPQVRANIPLQDIQSAFFESGEFIIDNSSLSGTLLYINSKPFAYFANESKDDTDVLNHLFGKLSMAEYADAAPPPRPIWALEREELIHEASSPDIECVGIGISGGKYKTYITNARIVRIPDRGVKTSGNYNQKKFFHMIELSEVRSSKRDAIKLVLELKGGRKISFFALPPALLELDKYIGIALKRMIPVVTFEDLDEKFLFKEQGVFNTRALCSKEFWKTMFGGEHVVPKFCVTNKRLLFYYIDQVSVSGGGEAINFSVTAPVLKCIWLPLYGVTSLERDLFNTTRLHITNCTPAGCIGRSSVIPGIYNQGSEIKYDPCYTDNISGSAIVSFFKWSCLTKKERQEVTSILRSLLPGQCFKGIE